MRSFSLPRLQGWILWVLLSTVASIVFTAIWLIASRERYFGGLYHQDEKLLEALARMVMMSVTVLSAALIERTSARRFRKLHLVVSACSMVLVVFCMSVANFIATASITASVNPPGFREMQIVWILGMVFLVVVGVRVHERWDSPVNEAPEVVPIQTGVSLLPSTADAHRYLTQDWAKKELQRLERAARLLQRGPDGQERLAKIVRDGTHLVLDTVRQPVKGKYPKLKRTLKCEFCSPHSAARNALLLLHWVTSSSDRMMAFCQAVLTTKFDREADAQLMHWIANAFSGSLLGSFLPSSVEARHGWQHLIDELELQVPETQLRHWRELRRQINRSLLSQGYEPLWPMIAA